MEYLVIGFAALAFGAAVAVWFKLGSQAGDTRRLLEALQRQDGVLAAMRSDVAATRTELREEQARFRTELLAELGRARSEAEQRAGTDTARVEALSQQQRTALLDTLKDFRTALITTLEQARAEQLHRLADVTARMQTLTGSMEQRLELVRTSVEGKLQEIRTDNAAQLEQMRATVDEKLQSTLEQRLGESFRSVGEQLERVHTGLGEMRNLATGVGDLKRVLTNVKTRGNWGEIQLGALLEQVLTPEQYATNVAVRPGSGERVEFAIRLPGRGDDADEQVWLPIDAKFPVEDYQRLIDAHEAADPVAAEAAGRALEARVRGCAHDIFSKYIVPPHTTDFAIMFLPTEGLYAEVARRVGLLESLQRECRVAVAGPSNLLALLNSLQMGFRTLAIQQRTSEVWSILGKVKTEFGKFEDVLAKVQKKLNDAHNTIEEAQKRTRVMSRQLRTVESGSPDAAGAPALVESEVVPQEPSMLQLAGTSEQP